MINFTNCHENNKITFFKCTWWLFISSKPCTKRLITPNQCTHPCRMRGTFIGAALSFSSAR